MRLIWIDDSFPSVGKNNKIGAKPVAWCREITRAFTRARRTAAFAHLAACWLLCKNVFFVMKWKKFFILFFPLRPSRSPTSATTFSSGQVKKRDPGNELAIRGWNIQTKMGIKGCVPLCQSKSRFCDRKFDFVLHWRPNQSKIAIRTIYLHTWIVPIGISIWFEMFVHWPPCCVINLFSDVRPG